MTRLRASIALVVLAVLLAPAAVHACPVCFGAADSPLLDSARLGVLAMVAVTLVVLGAFAAFFLRLRRLAVTHGEAERSVEVRS